MVSEIIEKYRAAVAQVATLRGQIQAAYEGLPTLEDKFKFVLELGSEFLEDDPWYCSHDLTMADGTELSLYDDFYWERHETKDITDFFDEMYYAFIGKHEYLERSEREKLTLANYIEVLNHDNKYAVLVRDLLEQGTGRATFDW